MASSTKPLIVMGSSPIYGHLMPIRAIAKGLVARGYEVTFVSASPYQKIMEEVGCDYVALEGYCNFTEADLDTLFAERYDYPPGPLQLAYDVEHCFMKTIPGQFEALQKALKRVQERHPGRPIVQVSEGLFQGSLPTTRGAPGIKPTGVMGIGVIPMALSSIDWYVYSTQLQRQFWRAGTDLIVALRSGQDCLLIARQKGKLETRP
jgi:hypothetical protein